MKHLKSCLLGLAVVAMLAAPALAEGEWYAGASVDTAPIFAVAGIILTAIASIWAIKKCFKFGNKS